MDYTKDQYIAVLQKRLHRAVKAARKHVKQREILWSITRREVEYSQRLRTKMWDAANILNVQ